MNKHICVLWGGKTDKGLLTGLDFVRNLGVINGISYEKSTKVEYHSSECYPICNLYCQHLYTGC